MYAFFTLCITARCFSHNTNKRTRQKGTQAEENTALAPFLQLSLSLSLTHTHTFTCTHILTRMIFFPHCSQTRERLQFVEYLHSTHNHIWNPDHDLVYQDMHLPLACYFIASSHNTYLMGDQLRSESSVEAYVRPLRDGCRCVEIDCWDGPGNEPIVYHGHTLTSKIKFQEVVKAVSEHAFDTTEYPLILSIENHCSLSQQEVMATMFTDAFGEHLITKPPDDCQEKHRDCYPSPEQLKFKVIIKHKKLEGASDSVVVSSKVGFGFWFLCLSFLAPFLLLSSYRQTQTQTETQAQRQTQRQTQTQTETRIVTLIQKHKNTQTKMNT